MNHRYRICRGIAMLLSTAILITGLVTKELRWIFVGMGLFFFVFLEPKRLRS